MTRPRNDLMGEENASPLPLAYQTRKTTPELNSLECLEKAGKILLLPEITKRIKTGRKGQ
ncbi:MAG: hypothetical protein AAB331_02100 [Planctomycetota bacterium]